MILAAGEQVTSGLLALCLQDVGIQSRSFLSWQVPIHTDGAFTNASIKSIEPQWIQEILDQGGVPVIAGFQGVYNNCITTLGRGGSDLTAVALAHALKADFCDIYTDVAGVYTADPRIIGNARKISLITFSEMLELATHGAKVLQDKCVSYASEYGVRLRVFSSFHEEEGTEITESISASNDNAVQGIAHSFQAAKIRLRGAQLCSFSVSKILREHSVSIDGLTHFMGDQESIQLGITKADIVPAVAALKKMTRDMSLHDIDVDQHVCKITIVGRGMDEKTLPAYILKTLNQARIFAEVVGLTDLKMTLIVKEDKTTEPIRLLHDSLNLHLPHSNIA